MSSRRVIALSLLAVACTNPVPPPPGPMTLASPKPPIEVVQTAARVLTEQGFDIAVSDATGGIVVARRTRSRQGHGDAVACKWRVGSGADRTLSATLTVNIAARPTPTGTSVVLRSSMLSRYSGPFALPESEADCVSTGQLERQLVSLLGLAPAGQ